MAELEAAKTDCVNGPLFRHYAEQFMRRQARRWKPATRESNRHLLRRYLLPFFGHLRVADIAPADVRRWFDSMSATPTNANRTLPVLSVMMTQAELWQLRPQGSNPCRKIRRYPAKPRERFLSLEELKRPVSCWIMPTTPRLRPRSGCSCLPARAPRRSPASGGSGFAVPVPCYPIPRPGRKRSSYLHPRA